MGKIKKNIFLTGQPGVGKTTLIVKIIKELPSAVEGFYTEEIRERGERKGFKIFTLNGQTGILAHIDNPGPNRVGKYGVAVEEFERMAVSALERALSQGKAVVIDEIGKMELCSEKFKKVLCRVLDLSPLVIATIAQKGDFFIESIKKRSDVKLFTVTLHNRDNLIEEIKTLINSVWPGKDSPPSVS